MTALDLLFDGSSADDNGPSTYRLASISGRRNAMCGGLLDGTVTGIRLPVDNRYETPYS